MYAKIKLTLLVSAVFGGGLLLLSCASNPASTVGGSLVQSSGSTEATKTIILNGINEFNRRHEAPIVTSADYLWPGAIVTHRGNMVVGRVVSPGLIIARQDGNGWWLEIAIHYNAENVQLEFKACSDSLGDASDIHERFQQTQRKLLECIIDVSAQRGAMQYQQWNRDARTPIY